MKKKYSFAIDEDIMSEFKKSVKEDSINMSRWVQNHIEKYLKERRNLNEQPSRIGN